MLSDSTKTLLIFSQVYVPDPASVGQHMADAAEEMSRRGWHVIVYTSNCGYDNPEIKYRSREILNGVHVKRLPFSSFGKKNLIIRLSGQIPFILQCLFRGLFTKNLKCIFVTTSPPMGAVTAIIIGFFRNIPIKYWLMDLNPDQAVAIGKLKSNNLFVKIFNIMNKVILMRTKDIIALDRFMAQRLTKNSKDKHKSRIAIMPPWPMEGYLEIIEHENNPFRKEHRLENKFVIMHSGNHSTSHPLTTIIDAAKLLRSDDSVVFMFIGGGIGKTPIDRAILEDDLTNLMSLPYQPLEIIRFSLSAADIHLVSMGNNMVGCVHPCKFYGAMSLKKPILLIGPKSCHISEIIDEHDIGWRVDHGDVDGVVSVIRDCLAMSRTELANIGTRAKDVIDKYYSKEILCREFCNILEKQ